MSSTKTRLHLNQFSLNARSNAISQQFPYLQFTVEKDFSYFCRYDDLTCSCSSISKELPAIADSCYLNKAKAFFHSS